MKGDEIVRQNALLRLLLACFLFYMAWPSVQVQGGGVASYFWIGWLVFFLFVAGSNLATVMKIPDSTPLHSTSESETKRVFQAH